MQFVGAFVDYEWTGVWKAKVEHKCRFFTWLILQNKLWTTGRILKTGGQANSVCQLCWAHQESVLHMITQCEYSKRIWSCLAAWIGISLQPLPLRNYRGFKTWWQSMIREGTQGKLQC
jgi:hypothetical protein